MRTRRSPQLRAIACFVFAFVSMLAPAASMASSQEWSHDRRATSDPVGFGVAAASSDADEVERRLRVRTFANQYAPAGVMVKAGALDARAGVSDAWARATMTHRDSIAQRGVYDVVITVTDVNAAASVSNRTIAPTMPSSEATVELIASARLSRCGGRTDCDAATSSLHLACGRGSCTPVSGVTLRLRLTVPPGGAEELLVRTDLVASSLAAASAAARAEAVATISDVSILPVEPMISSGVFGTVRQREGDCMPSPDPSDCREFPVARTVYAYTPPINIAEMESTYYRGDRAPHEVTVSSQNGWYEMELPPGRYSIFVDDGDPYCNGFNSPGDACLVELSEHDRTFYPVIIDHAAH